MKFLDTIYNGSPWE